MVNSEDLLVNTWKCLAFVAEPDKYSEYQASVIFTCIVESPDIWLKSVKWTFFVIKGQCWAIPFSTKMAFKVKVDFLVLHKKSNSDFTSLF